MLAAVAVAIIRMTSFCSVAYGIETMASLLTLLIGKLEFPNTTYYKGRKLDLMV